MAFADPHVCPDCRGPIEGTSVCSTCGLDLRDPQVRELWQTLLHADALLTAATSRRDAAHVGPPAPQPPGPAQPQPPAQPQRPPAPEYTDPLPQPVTSDLPRYPGAPPTVQATAPLPVSPPLEPAPARQRSWSVGTVLLGLGAIGLVVAAIIFVSRSWDSIGLVGKALVLAASTAAITAAAVWVTRRPLRSSAEALWAVALTLLAVDLLGARGEGLFGLDTVPWPWFVAATGVVIAVAGAVVVRGSRTWLEADLITAAVAAAAGIVLAGSGAATIGDLQDFWHAFIALVVSGVLGLVLRFSGSTVIAWGARLVVAVWFAIAAVLAVQEAAEHPSLDALLTDGRGVPLLLMSLAALVVAATVPLARLAMTAVAVVGLSLLVTLPSGEAWTPEGGWIAVAVLVALVAWLGSLGTGPWLLGLRWGAGVGGLFVLSLAVWWLADVLHVIGEAFDRFGELGSTVQVGTWVGEYDPVATIIVAVALAVAAWSALRWLGKPAGRVHAAAMASVIAIGVLGSVLAFDPPSWVLALELVATAAIAVAVSLRRRAPRVVWPDVFWVAAAASLVALGVSVAAQPVMAATWIVVALGAGAVVAGPEALRVPLVPPSLKVLGRCLAALVGPLLAGGLAVGVAAANGLQATSSLVAVVGSSLVLVAATRAPEAVRPYLEGGAAAALTVSAVAPDSSLIASIGFTIIGVTACAIAAATVDRRWYVWPGIAAFVVAYVLLIVDSGFGFVEAYTLPLAAIALGGGVLLLRRTPSTSSWVALGPGLVLGLLPSLPQALADPTGLRALLLGLAATVTLAVGARLGRQAPFLLGVGVAALVLVFNIGPYANAAPRVLIISIVSAMFIGLGVTWEDRVRDGRKVMAFVKEMR
ncbi:SCO7613 C-terminal domain-containing membrane protein [Aeromicrobium sp. CF3.5]|uniref:SCO7613 C-terminal domain-containing membrane protein n=1 Tax=Aeromicrobium sp. CF3.5 TaxID=3373078 RepID=UPI003EE667F6